jgi:hypothetical protein
LRVEVKVKTKLPPQLILDGELTKVETDLLVSIYPVGGYWQVRLNVSFLE